MSNKCVLCDEEGKEFYGYTICDSCILGLRLFKDETIKKYRDSYDCKNGPAYESEIDYRLDYLEKDYIKKRIKLLHINDRLKHIQ